MSKQWITKVLVSLLYKMDVSVVMNVSMKGELKMYKPDAYFYGCTLPQTVLSPNNKELIIPEGRFNITYEDARI